MRFAGGAITAGEASQYEPRRPSGHEGSAERLPVSLPREMEIAEAAFDPAAVCSAGSVQSVSPLPVNHPRRPQSFGSIPGLKGTSGMTHLFRNYSGKDVHEG